METQPNSSLPEIPPGTVDEEASVSLEPIQSFLKTLVRCNPFYLFSALLLLYGVYRISVDPAFLSTERLQVIFNFSSIQLYGLMLVVTVTFLARRKIFYDATLLYCIENVLVLIPFILISHAVFQESSLAPILALVGCALVAGKFAVFKGCFPGLNLPRRLLLVGSLIVVVNTAIPLVFRKGLDTDNELWTLRSQYCWFLLLPLLVMAGHVLNPLRPGHGETAEHRKQWLPLTVLLLWITGTAAHLYSVGYVDDQKFELAKFSVLAWAIGWLLCAKITLLLSRFTPAAPEIMLSLPIAAPLLAWERPEIAVTLHILNAAIFGMLCIRWKGLRIPAILGGVSLLLALFTVPNDWLTPVIKGYNKAGLAFSLVAALLMIKAIRTRTAKWALIGSFVTVIFLLGLALNSRFSPHYALQFAPLFALVHSLFWKGPQERGSTVLLLGAATILCLDSYVIAQQGHYAPHLLPYLCAAPLLVIASFRRAVVPIIAAIASMLVPPLSYATSVAEGTPTGILALMASFILFAVGTTFAVWKNRFSNNPKGTKEMSI